MKNSILKNIIAFVCCITIAKFANSQSVGINTTSPDSSAVLELKSTAKGLLMPRMATAQMNSIFNPANGLLVYNTDSGSFCLYNGTAWVKIIISTQVPIKTYIADADTNTKVETEHTTNENYIRFTLNGTEYFRMNKGSLEFINNASAVYMGKGSGGSDTYGLANSYNIGIGDSALNKVTGSSVLTMRNVAVGGLALQNVGSGSGGTFGNIAVGYNSLNKLKDTGSNNIAIGQNVAGTKTSGTGNLFMGGTSGYYNANGSYNVFLGNGSGFNETGSNKLYIENSTSSSPLIYGDFSTNKVTINDSLSSKYFSMTDGANNGYVLQSDANGNGTWVASSVLTPSLIKDADANTKIEVEQSSNENKIHMTMNGTEYLVLDKGHIYTKNTAGGLYVGEDAGANDTVGSNTFLGYQSGMNSVSGGGNTYVGKQVGKSNDIGVENTAIGDEAFKSNQNGSYNVAIGRASQEASTTASHNVSVGAFSLSLVSTGGNNVAVGNTTLGSATTGTQNTAIGDKAGASTTGNSNVFVGYNAGYNETGSDKLYIANSNTISPLIYGNFSNKHLTINDSLTSKYIQLTNGANSGYILKSDASGNGTWINPNTATGALRYVNNSYISSNAGAGGTGTSDGSTASRQSIFLGDNSGYSNTNGQSNVAVGKSTLRYNTTGSQNVALGNWALNVSTTGNYNVALGTNALITNSTGSNNVSVGNDNLYDNTTGANNTSTGTSASANNSVGDNNSSFGGSALYNNDTGSNNTVIGNAAGYNTKGDNNVLIGYNAGYNESGSNKLYISNSNTSTPLIYGDFSNKIIKINDSLQTKYVKLTNGATSGYVLQSDASGNGTWVNPTSLSVTESDPQVSSSTTSKVPRWTGSTLSDGTIYDNGTNVGIANTSPSSLFSVGSSSQFQVNSSGAIAAATGITSSGTVTFTGIATGMVKSASGVLSAATAGTDYQAPMSAGTGVSISSNTINTKWTTSGNDIYNNNSGNIGVGNTSPSDKLHVSGSLRIDGGKIKTANTGQSVYVGESAGNSDALSSTLKNVGIGYLALYSNTSGVGNIGIGYQALRSTTANSNTAIGYLSMTNNTAGYYNSAIGQGSLSNNTNGKYNLAIGGLSLYYHDSGDYNTAVGMQSLINNISGDSNTAVGYNAGYNNNGSGNVFLGGAAGYNESGSNKLYIDNSSSSSPLLYGDFSNDYLNVNGKLGVNITTPQAYMDITGTNAGTSSLLLRSGNAGSGSSSNQILFGYNGANTYQHAIKSRHNSGSKNNNAIDFYVWSQGIDASTTAGTKLVMTIDGKDSGMVGIGTSTPSSPLHVYADGAKTADFTNTYINNAATSSTTSVDKVGLEIQSTGSWTGSSAKNIGLYVSSVTGGTNNYDAIFNGGGSIGIGTTAPTKGKVEINGSVTYPTNGTSYSYYNGNNNTGNSSTSSTPYSLYASSRIGASEFNAFSDARIKNIKSRTNNANDLNTLMQIQVTNYTLKDSIEKGSKLYKKVIAQEVEKVYPNAVTKMTDFIPNIYRLAQIKNGFVTIQNVSIKVGDKVKLIFGNEHNSGTVTAVTAQGFQTDLMHDGNVFVYGTEVNDFRTVDYEALSILNISATQELVKQVDALKASTETQNQQIKLLQAQLSDIQTLLKNNATQNANATVSNK